MFCKKCGNKIEVGTFCSKCGTNNAPLNNPTFTTPHNDGPIYNDPFSTAGTSVAGKKNVFDTVLGFIDDLAVKLHIPNIVTRIVAGVIAGVLAIVILCNLFSICTAPIGGCATARGAAKQYIESWNNKPGKMVDLVPKALVKDIKETYDISKGDIKDELSDYLDDDYKVKVKKVKKVKKCGGKAVKTCRRQLEILLSENASDFYDEYEDEYEDVELDTDLLESYSYDLSDYAYYGIDCEHFDAEKIKNAYEVKIKYVLTDEDGDRDTKIDTVVVVKYGSRYYAEPAIEIVLSSAESAS